MLKPSKRLEKPYNSEELTVENTNSNSELDLCFYYEHNVSLGRADSSNCVFVDGTLHKTFSLKMHKNKDK